MKLSTFQPGHPETLGLFEEPEVLGSHLQTMGLSSLFVSHQSVTRFQSNHYAVVPGLV